MNNNANFFQLLTILGVRQVHSIRDAAANNLKRLAEEFGPEWAMQHIIPQVFYDFDFAFACTLPEVAFLSSVIHGTEHQD